MYSYILALGLLNALLNAFLNGFSLVIVFVMSCLRKVVWVSKDIFLKGLG